MRRSLLTLVLIFGTGLLMAQPKRPSIVDSLKHQLAKAPHDSTRLRLCVEIGRVHLTENRYDSLYRYTQRGFTLLKKSPSHYYAGDLHYFLARCYRAQNVYKRAIAPMRQAIRHAQQARAPKKLASFQYSLAMIYADAGDLARSIDQVSINLKQLVHYPNDNLLADNYLLVIELFKTLKNRPMHEHYINQYLALVKPSWLPVDQMFAYFLKAESLTEKGVHQEAEWLYRRAFQQARLTDNLTYVAVMQCEIGKNQRAQQHYQAALQAFTRAFSTANTIGDKALMAQSKRELALTYLATNQPALALKPARYALQMARLNKQPDGILASQTSLVMALKANGQFREALQLVQEQQALKEKHFSENNMQKIAQMQAQFDAETKEKTIKILQKNAQISQLNALRQQEQLTLAQRTQLAGVLVIGLMALVIGLIIYGLRKSRRNYATLTRQQELLQQTASQLAETNSVKDKLFSLIGHDLRSPVASMKNNLRQLRAIDGQTDQLPPLMDRLDKQVDTVLTLLTNLLDWSMIQLKGFQSILQPVRLADVTEEVISQASELIRQKKITVVEQVETTHLALADRHQIRAVVRNLLSNAIKFTPTGGFIRLVSRIDGNHVELHIRDSGLGMSDEQVATLFTTPQMRAGTLGESGTGLGLRICQEMLERQGGQLTIKSRVGKGTFVRIRLAAPQVATVPHQPSLVTP